MTEIIWWTNGLFSVFTGDTEQDREWTEGLNKSWSRRSTLREIEDKTDEEDRKVAICRFREEMSDFFRISWDELLRMLGESLEDKAE